MSFPQPKISIWIFDIIKKIKVLRFQIARYLTINNILQILINVKKNVKARAGVVLRERINNSK